MHLSGRAAMIMWSSFILDELAGLRNSAPVAINNNPQSRKLAAETGIVTILFGPSNKKGATWGEVRYYGITTNAKKNAELKRIK